ncbi:MAG TPA: PAS domain S-box protein, partial [Nitrosopumilaceae archaeon]|nr:PAS domain S-box protein [Nitrosopumilaceae archaeon]
EIQLKTKTGNKVWVLVSGAPYTDNKGNVIGSIAIQTNINELKKAQETHLQNELRMNEAQEIAHIGSWERYFDSKWAIWSSGLCKIFGLAPDNNVQSVETFLSFVHPEDVNFVKEQIKKQRESLAQNSYHHRIIRKDGNVRYLVTESRFCFNSEGKPTSFFGISHDVTEETIAKLETEFDKKNLSALINNTTDLIWSVDKSFNLITSNESFDEKIKQLSGSVIPKGSYVLPKRFNEEQLNRFKRYYERAFSGETFKEIEYIQNPIELWSEISFFPILEGNSILGTACFSRNITERKLFEMELEKNNSEIISSKNKLEYSELRLKEAQAISHIGSWETSFLT